MYIQFATNRYQMNWKSMQFKLKLYTEYNMTKYKPQTAKTTFVDNFITHTKKKLAKHM